MNNMFQTSEQCNDNEITSFQITSVLFGQLELKLD